MSVWGNGKPDQYEENGRTYIAGIPKDAFDDFNFPSLNMDIVQAPVHAEKQVDVTAQTVHNVTAEASETDAVDTSVPLAKIKKLDAANKLLTKWTNEHSIDISATVGASGTVHSAIYDEIPGYLYSAINWQAEGVTTNNAKKSKNHRYYLWH